MLGLIPFVEERLDEDFRPVSDGIFILIDGEISQATVLIPLHLEGCTNKCVAFHAKLGGLGFKDQIGVKESGGEEAEACGEIQITR